MSETSNFRSGYLDRQSDFGALSSVVQLVADNQAVVLDDYQGVLRLTSDNTTAANRTFTITNGSVMGQRLSIIFESGASTTAQLLTAGNVKLTGTWTPTQYNALQLIWDDALTLWIEDTRNSGISTPAGAVADAAVASPVASALGASYVQASVNAEFDTKADQTALLTLQTTVNALLASMRLAGFLTP